MAALLSKAQNRLDAVAPAQQASRVKPLVLVAEDHEDTCFLLNYLLNSRGCRVVEARDGEQALRLAASEIPDLILMDIGLPHLDGLAVTRRMRELVELQNVPIIFLSGHAEPSFRAEALRQGGNDFLVKPFTLDELERALDKQIGKGRLSNQESKSFF